MNYTYTISIIVVKEERRVYGLESLESLELLIEEERKQVEIEGERVH